MKAGRREGEPGSWKDGTTSWSAEVLVTANKGDSLKNTISWR